MNTARWVAGVAALLTAVTLNGCSAPAPDRTASDQFVGHVHGLGVDPADGVLYVASHGGVFRLQDGRLHLVAGRAQDTMGFTVVGPNHFLGSGHPPPMDLGQPSHLGLIESRDAAASWTSVSLAGEADFHALEQGVDALYGYDSRSGRVLKTSDQQGWVPVLTATVADLAVHPTQPNAILVVTTDGLIRTGREDRAATLLAPSGLVQVEWPTPDLLVGVTATAGLYESTDAGDSWTLRSRIPDGHVQAFDAGSGSWHLATDQGLYSSSDQGATWNQLL